VLWETMDTEEPDEVEDEVTLGAGEESRGATWVGEGVTVGPNVEEGKGSAGVLSGSGCKRVAVRAGNSGGAVSVRWRCCRLAGLRVPVPFFFGLLICSVSVSRGPATSGGPWCRGIYIGPILGCRQSPQIRFSILLLT